MYESFIYFLSSFYKDKLHRFGLSSVLESLASMFTALGLIPMVSVTLSTIETETQIQTHRQRWVERGRETEVISWLPLNIICIGKVVV